MRQDVRARLRAATNDNHRRVDEIFSGFDLNDRDSYRRFLLAQAAAHLPLERALDAGFAERVLADWPERRRADRLRDDLAALALDEPEPEAVRPLANDAAALGTLYVLEGSRLGAAYLRRSVPPAFPQAYLEPGSSNLWRGLIDVLERSLTSDTARQSAIDAAHAAFDAFERSGRRFLKAS